MRHTVLTAAACGAALLLSPLRARADEAQDHTDRAEALARAERYRDALVELRAAYAIRQSPRLLYLMAQAQQRLGETEAACASYERFLVAGTDADPGLLRDAAQQLAALRPPVPKAAPPRPAGASIAFVANHDDDRYTLEAGGRRCETPCKLALRPGPHRISVGGTGSFQLDLQVPPRSGIVRVQNPWSPMLISSVVMMTAGSAMMIGGNIGPLLADGPFGAMIAFGWVFGPLTHLVGIGLMGGALAHLSDANTVRPLALDVAAAPQGGVVRMTFSF